MLISSINSVSKSNYKHSHESSTNKQKVSFGNAAQTFIHASQVVEGFGLLTVIGLLTYSLINNHKTDKAILKNNAQSLIEDINKEKTLKEMSEDFSVKEIDLLKLKNMISTGTNPKKVTTSAMKILKNASKN